MVATRRLRSDLVSRIYFIRVRALARNRTAGFIWAQTLLIRYPRCERGMCSLVFCRGPTEDAGKSHCDMRSSEDDEMKGAAYVPDTLDSESSRRCCSPVVGRRVMICRTHGITRADIYQCRTIVPTPLGGRFANAVACKLTQLRRNGRVRWRRCARGKAWEGTVAKGEASGAFVFHTAMELFFEFASEPRSI